MGPQPFALAVTGHFNVQDVRSIESCLIPFIHFLAVLSCLQVKQSIDSGANTSCAFDVPFEAFPVFGGSMSATGNTEEEYEVVR